MLRAAVLSNLNPFAVLSYTATASSPSLTGMLAALSEKTLPWSSKSNEGTIPVRLVGAV